MRARIYQPSKTAMSSGTAQARKWLLEYIPAQAKEIDPLMGWTSSAETQTQVRLTFESKEAALAYAQSKGIAADVFEPQKRAPNLRPGGYGENFAFSRREPWSH